MPARARAARGPVPQAAAPALFGRLVAPGDARRGASPARRGALSRATAGRAKGVASTFVAERLRVGDRLKVYVKPNKNFRLPEDPDRPVVMIGPGTGVAPFRAFLQERQAIGAKGRNWLFFGDRNYTHDFLYQLDWQALAKDGVLEPDRRRLLARPAGARSTSSIACGSAAPSSTRWLEDGAHLYVCGDEKAMAKDVHAMLARIVADQSGRSAEAAEAWLAELKRARRYQRDVY